MRRISILTTLFLLVILLPVRAHAEAPTWVFSPNDTLRGGEFFAGAFYSYTRNELPFSIFDSHSGGIYLSGAAHDRAIFSVRIPFRARRVEPKPPFFGPGVDAAGIGDVSFGVQLLLLYEHEQDLSWELGLSGGVALPTGEYNTRNVLLLLEPESVQPGSGAVAYSVGINGAYRTPEWKTYWGASYIDRGESDFTDYGQAAHLFLRGAFEPWRRGEAPWQGFAIHFGTSVTISSDQKLPSPYPPLALGGGGWVCSFSPGIEYFLGNWVSEFSASVPVAHDLNGGFLPPDFTLQFDVGRRF